MVLSIKVFSVSLAAAMLAAAPAAAHNDHEKKARLAAEQVSARMGVQPAGRERPSLANGAASPASATEPSTVTNVSTEAGEQGIARLIDWLGRLHPMVVHFPIAFFPAALFTAIVGRRRASFAAPVRFLVVAGGIMAPAAALLGWFDGGLIVSDSDLLLRAHRWLGTAIGISGPALAIMAIRNAEAHRQRSMIVALSIITAAIVVQGWFGGALVHGADHMNW